MLNRYKNLVKSIVRSEGGYREKEILKHPFQIEKSETWSKDHRVLNVVSEKEGKDGYRDGFAVDIATFSIVG